MISSLFKSGISFVVLSTLVSLPPALANESPLHVSTSSEVDVRGGVTVFLTLKNTGGKPLFDIHPVFHFHHTKVMAPAIPKLEPGKAVTLENNDP